MTRCPYTFPHRSRKAMVAYLLDRRTYADHYTPYVFSWNVKAHHVNWERPEGESELNPALDDAWSALLAESNPYGPERAAFEYARREVEEGDWSSYPGDDQGDWKFYFAGRQGGHIVLDEWRGYRLGGKHREDVESWLQEMDAATLRRFYRGIRTADSDFTPAKASENVEFFLNDVRAQWEQEITEERDRAAEEYAQAAMAARPDMYGSGCAA